MRPFLAALLSATLFISTLNAQTGVQPTSQSFERSSPVAQGLSLNGVWEITDKDDLGYPEILGAQHSSMNRASRTNAIQLRKVIKVTLDAPWTDTGLKLVKAQDLSVAASAVG
jgi:hypothetical protein